MKDECFSTTVLSVSRDHKMAAVNLSILESSMVTISVKYFLNPTSNNKVMDRT